MMPTPTMSDEAPEPRMTRSRSSSSNVPPLVKQQSSTASLTAGLAELKRPSLGKRKSSATIEDDEPDPAVVAERTSLADTSSSRAAKAMFQKAAAAPPPKTGKQIVMKAKFDNKVSKFEDIAAGVVAAKGAKGKAAMFEQKGKEPEPVVRKTWKAGAGAGQYKKKTEFGQGVAPKRSLADLP